MQVHIFESSQLEGSYVGDLLYPGSQFRSSGLEAGEGPWLWLPALSWVLTSLQPHLQGQLSLRLRGILYSKGHQGILASTETSRRGKYLGKAFLKLGMHGEEKRTNILDQISFAQGSVLESKQPLSLGASPAAWRRMKLLFQMFHVQREERTHERNA